MRYGILFSGGKDSTLALAKAQEKGEVVCLITILSKNTESYMFHTPNIHLSKLQAEALELPLMEFETEGVKEEELVDLKEAIKEAKEKYQLDAIVTGAVASNYQATRIQKICDELELECFNPLWQMNQEKLLREVLKYKIKVIISGIFAYPLTEKWLGRELDEEMITELAKLQEKYQLNPAGEGGEIETTAIDGPMFTKRIEITSSENEAQENEGIYHIRDAKLVEK